MNFADFSKAFSSVHRHSLWRTLRASEISFNLVEIIRCFFSKVALTCWLWWHPVWSQGRCQAGLRHVCSAFQSCCRLERAAHHRGQGQGHWMDPCYLEELDYAADLGLALLLHKHCVYTDRSTFSLNLPWIQTPAGVSVTNHKLRRKFNLPSLSHRKINFLFLSFSFSFPYRCALI